MVWRMGRRRWDGGEARRGHGLDQQDGAGGVVDDEPAGRAEASGSEVGAAAVAGYDEQIGAFGGSEPVVDYRADHHAESPRKGSPAAPTMPPGVTR